LVKIDLRSEPEIRPGREVGETVWRGPQTREEAGK